jgi:hypothetical protein
MDNPSCDVAVCPGAGAGLGMLPELFARLKVGHTVPSAPRQLTQTRTFWTSPTAHGTLGTALPATKPFG